MRAEISNVTGILCQHVRNVLEGQDGGRTVQPVAQPQNPADLVVEQDRIGSAVPFSALIERIESGSQVTITRQGRPVAQIVSYEAAQRMAAVRKAMAGMDEIRKRVGLRGLRIKDLIEEGRR